jgi:streptomycin 6-kinase
MGAKISKQFKQRILAVGGQAAQQWLDELPRLIEELSARWQLRLGEPFAAMAYNYVAPASRVDGSAVVLKISPPAGEYADQALALRSFAGRGVSLLLEDWPEKQAMLIERLQPGHFIFDLEDDEVATREAAKVMRQMWTEPPAQNNLSTVRGWGEGFKRVRELSKMGKESFPQELLDRAEGVYFDLLSSNGPDRLLHGDFHHWNLISAQRQPWLAIDPKGLVGEAEYDLGAWLRNAFPADESIESLKAYTTRRINQFSAELGFDRQRVRAWGYSQSVLSAAWDYEVDLPEWRAGIKIAELF